MTEPQMLGAAINSVKRAVQHFDVLFEDFPRIEELRTVTDEGRYPVSLYRQMTDHMEQQFGYGSMLRLGKEVGRTVVDVSLSKLPIETVAQAIGAVQQAHEHFCKPTVGAFVVIDQTPNELQVHYTAPYNCVLQEGLLFAIAQHYGADMPMVSHTTCLRDGADHCLFIIGL